jgi:Holliday junction resolvase RusA-like endonuclease
VISEEASNGFSRVLVKEFVLAIEPPKTTNQASLRILKTKDGRQFVGKQQNSKAKQAQNLLRFALLPHKPTTLYTQPIKLYVQYNYSFNKTEKKAIKDLGWYPHHKRPDGDNLLKGLLDVMTGMFWKDDSQVYHMEFVKCWASSPCIKIAISEIYKK